MCERLKRSGVTAPRYLGAPVLVRPEAPARGRRLRGVAGQRRPGQRVREEVPARVGRGVEAAHAGALPGVEQGGASLDPRGRRVLGRLEQPDVNVRGAERARRLR